MLLTRHFSTDDAAPPEPRIYALADGGVFVLPAGWPLALAEPLAAALPETAHDLPAHLTALVTTAVGALAENRLLSEAECQVLTAEAAALLLSQRAAFLPGGAVTAARLDTALQDGAVPADVLVIAPENISAADVSLLEAQRAYRGLPPARLLLPAAAPAALALAARRFRQELRATAASFGAPHLQAALGAVMDACQRGRVFGFDPARVPALAQAVRQAQALGVPDAALQTALLAAENGAEDANWFADAVHDEDDTPALSRISLSLPDALVEAALTGHAFAGRDAARMLEDIAALVWHSGAPALVFGDRGGCRALDAALGQKETADGMPVDVPMARGVLNLRRFVDARGVDTAGLHAAVRVLSLMLAAQPAEAFTIGLTDLAPALMTLGLAYDSAAGRSHAAALAGFVTAAAAETMALLAERAGGGMAAGREGYARELKDMAAALGGSAALSGDMARTAVAVDPRHLDAAFARAAATLVDAAADAVRRHGVWRAPYVAAGACDVLHALVDARAPALMPVPALVARDAVHDLVFDSAARDVYRRRLAAEVPAALQRLGYTAAQIDDIHFYAVGHGTLFEAPRINHASLKAKGFDDAHLARVDAALAGAAHMSHALNAHVVGHAFCVDALGLSPADIDAAGFDLARALGFDDDAVEAASLHACGAGHLQGAPHLRPEHLAVFDCDDAVSLRGIAAAARLRMQAAIEPFAAGGVAQTLLLPPHSLPDSVSDLIVEGWQLGLKSLSIYRAGCGLDVPVAGGNDNHFFENKLENVKDSLLTLP